MIKPNIIISTIQRPNKTPYLDRLLTSLRQDYDGIVHLIIGGEDQAYTDKYSVTSGYIKHPIGEGEKVYPTKIRRAALGYYIALKLDKENPLLILEDDAVLVPGWYKQLEERISFIPDEKYILSLITPTGSVLPDPQSTVPSVQRYQYQAILEYKTKGQLPISTIVTYSNTTGIYYPTSMLQSSLLEFIWKFGVNGDAVYDLVVGQYMFRYDLPIYIAVPNLLYDVDVSDSSLGTIKQKATVNYADWDYTV